MAGSTLFGYTVEDDDGKLVITVTGALASSLLQRFSADAVGQNPRLMSSLLPFAELGSRAVQLQPRRPLRPSRPMEAAPPPDAEPPDIKEIFGQGFDRSHSEFEAQLAAYRELLGGGSSRADRSLAEAPIPDMAVPRRSQRIVKRAKRRK